MRDRRRFVVITPTEINGLGLVMAVPVTTGGAFSQRMGLAVPVSGRSTKGFAVCNQVRTFDIEARTKTGSAKFVEMLDQDTVNEIISRVLSIIDPEGI